MNLGLGEWFGGARRRITFTQSDYSSTEYSTDLTPRPLFKLLTRGQHQTGSGVCCLRLPPKSACVVGGVRGHSQPSRRVHILISLRAQRRRAFRVEEHLFSHSVSHHRHGHERYCECLKRGLTIYIVPITSQNINRFSNFFHWWTQ